jgi:hypothetical protein
MSSDSDDRRAVGQEATKRVEEALARLSPERRAFLDSLNAEHCRRGDGGLAYTTAEVMFHLATDDIRRDQTGDERYSDDEYARSMGMDRGYVATLREILGPPARKPKEP